MQRKAFIQLLVAYDILNGAILFFLFWVLTTAKSVAPESILKLYAILSVHVLFMVGANLGVALRKSYGPLLVLVHSGLFTVFMIASVAFAPAPAPESKGKQSTYFEAGRLVGTVIPIVLQALVAAAAYRAFRIPEDESVQPVAADTADTHSAAATILVQAVAADGSESPQKLSAAAGVLGQLVGPHVKQPALERRIRAATQMAGNEAALTRACEVLSARFSDEQNQWFLEALTTVAGQDELALGFVADVRAKLESTQAPILAKPLPQKQTASGRAKSIVPAKVARPPKPRPRA